MRKYIDKNSKQPNGPVVVSVNFRRQRHDLLLEFGDTLLQILNLAHRNPRVVLDAPKFSHAKAISAQSKNTFV